MVALPALTGFVDIRSGRVLQDWLRLRCLHGRAAAMEREGHMRDFDHFSPDALQFLSDLRANNTRVWFTSNKSIYETEIKEPTKRFAAAMCAALAAFTGQPHAAKIYRINRDIRFSRDKTPYNAHVHLSFIPESDRKSPPMWHFGLSPDRLSLGCGVFQFEKQDLAAFRAAMDGPSGGALIRLAARLRDAGIRIAEPELKRVPPGFARDHPHAEALRRKGFTGWKDINDVNTVTRTDLVERTVDELRPLVPVYDLLSGL